MRGPIFTGNPTVAPYSPAYEANGMIFVSGQIPMDPSTSKLVEGDMTVQTERAMQNLKVVLAHANVGMDCIVKTTCFLADIADFAAFNEVYATYFPDDKPARSCFAVKDLPLGAKVEVEAIAVRP